MIGRIIKWKRVNDRDRNFLVGVWSCWTRSFFGGCLRSLFADWFNHAKAYLPYGTLATNILGSLLIGIFAALVAKGEISQLANILLAGEFCGGLTTFSSFADGIVNLFDASQVAVGLLYIALNMLLGLLAVYLGLKVVLKTKFSDFAN